MNNNRSNEIYLKHNAFDILRYFSAFSVMLLHYTYYAITMSEHRVAFLGFVRRVSEFFPGVILLFSLSGFLVSASFERSSGKKEYLKKRVFRLYPQLWLCTLFNAVVIFLLAPELLDSSFLLWLATQFLGIANTPSCLEGFATGSVNGALWTIFTEVQLYLLLGLTYYRLKKLSKKGWYLLLVIAAASNLLCSHISQVMGGGVSKIIERLFLPYAIWFIIGVFCYQNREWVIPVLKKYIWLPVLIFMVNQGLSICKVGYYEDIVTGISLSFTTIGLAYVLPCVRIRQDISYGIFLYHWIMINIMVHLNLFNKISWTACMILFIVITLLAAYISKGCMDQMWKVLNGRKRG